MIQPRHIALSFSFAFLITIFSNILVSSNIQNDVANRFFILIGGKFFEGGYIQFLTFWSFFLSLELIKDKRKFIKEQKTLNSKTLLSEKGKLVYLSDDVNNIRVKTEESHHKESIINKVIIRACAKFRGTNSISEMMGMVSEQMQVYADHEYIEHAPIRYLNSAIPSLGFIGTVIGLSGAMKWANSGNMNVITSELAVAFDTTLVALILSLIINWYQSVLEKESDTLFLEIKHIITDRLINRIEITNK